MQEIEHFTPETLDEAAALLLAADAPLPPEVEGTCLIVQVTDGPRPCTLLVDLRRVPELNRLDYDERVGLRIGAAVPCPTILEFPPVHRLYPILVDACSPNSPGEAGERPTLGVVLGNASASAGIAPSLICLRASATVFGPHGWSELGVEALTTGSERGRIQPGEFVVDVRLPAPPPRSGGVYLRFLPPDAVDRPVAGICAFLAMEVDLDTCCGARLVLAGRTGVAVRALEVERFLAGKRLDDATVHEAAALAAENARHLGDSGAVAKERFEGAVVLMQRAILEALARVRRIAASQ